MTPAPRTLPVVEARARGGEWIVHLPGGRYVVRASEAAVRRLVAAEAPGSAITFLDGLPTSRSGAQTADVTPPALPAASVPPAGSGPGPRSGAPVDDATARTRAVEPATVPDPAHQAADGAPHPAATSRPRAGAADQLGLGFAGS